MEEPTDQLWNLMADIATIQSYAYTLGCQRFLNLMLHIFQNKVNLLNVEDYPYDITNESILRMIEDQLRIVKTYHVPTIEDAESNKIAEGYAGIDLANIVPLNKEII